jgi:hypothetical protein
MALRCNRIAALAVVIVALIAELGPAKTAIVYRTDRDEPMRGELVSEQPDKVIIKIANIDTPIPRSVILRVEYELSIAEQYAERTAEIEPTEFDRRYEAIKWLYGHNTLEADQLAARELRKLLDDKPDHPQAPLLLELVTQRIQGRLADPQDPNPDDDVPNGADQDTDKPTARPRTLDPEQRNLMKVIEIVLSARPRIAISDRDLREFYDKYRDDPAMTRYQGRRGKARFMRLKGHQHLELIFETKAKEYYSKVTIRDEPKPLQVYRQKIASGLVARHCGSCHGHGEADGLYLIPEDASGEEVAYTNLLILHRTQVGKQRLIDRDIPEESLLVQYALPREAARYPHPDVPGFKQYFRSEDDPRYGETIEWIGSLYRKAQYPVDYQIPTAASQDAQEAAPEQDDTESPEAD